MLGLHVRRDRGSRVRTVHVRVKGGYRPSVVRARAGEPLRIVFSREESSSCSEHVVFPAFGKSAMLPEHERVALELTPEHPGAYEFTCQLGMLRGLLVVHEAGSLDGARTGARRSALARALPPEEQRDTILAALAAWVCTIPLLLLAVVPGFGWSIGATVALGWLAVAVFACFVICARQVRLSRAPEGRGFPGAYRAGRASGEEAP